MDNNLFPEYLVLSAKLNGLIIQQAYQDWQPHLDRLIAEGKSLEEVGEAWRGYARQALEAADLNTDER